jgi:uncharacterized membrane protein
MDTVRGREEAQRRADRIRAFRAELAQVEREGALELTAEQRSALDTHLNALLRDLAGRFDVDTSDRDRQVSWGMRIASTLGALALCAAVVLFFYRFWGSIPVPIQVLLLLAAPLAGMAGAEFAVRRETAPYFTSLIALVAFAAFVLDLNALGSVFNLTPTPHALLAWCVFGVALAYRFGLRLLLAAGLVCGMGWVAALATSFAGLWTEFFQRPETIIAAGLLAAAAPRREHFAATHRLTGLLAVFLAILLLSFDGGTFLTVGRREAERLYQLAGLVGAAAAIWLGVRRQWNETVNLGAGAFVVFLYIRLFDWWWDWMPKYLFFLVVGLVSIGLLLAFRRLRGHERGAGHEA